MKSNSFLFILASGEGLLNRGDGGGVALKQQFRHAKLKVQYIS